MACPVCPAAGWVGGWVGGYFGIEPPQRPGGRALSALITANLISITVIALKILFDISLCVGGGFTLANIARVGIKTLILGVIYSIGVNYLLNHYVFPPPSQVEQTCEDSLDQIEIAEETSSPCCCKCKKE
jgi:hypothetical protein